MVSFLFQFIVRTSKYNEKSVFKIDDWDIFLKLMKDELIDKEIEAEPLS